MNVDKNRCLINERIEQILHIKFNYSNSHEMIKWVKKIIFKKWSRLSLKIKIVFKKKREPISLFHRI